MSELSVDSVRSAIDAWVRSVWAVYEDIGVPDRISEVLTEAEPHLDAEWLARAGWQIRFTIGEYEVKIDRAPADLPAGEGWRTGP